MRVTQAFRFELDPNALQREALNKHIGAALIVAPRSFPSTRLRSRCGHLQGRMPLSQRVFRCEACGLEVDRDLNVAVNLQKYGLPQNLHLFTAGMSMLGDHLKRATGFPSYEGCHETSSPIPTLDHPGPHANPPPAGILEGPVVPFPHRSRQG